MATQSATEGAAARPTASQTRKSSPCREGEERAMVEMTVAVMT